MVKMTLTFTYQRLDVLANAEYELTNQSRNILDGGNPGQSFREMASNFFQDPIKAYISFSDTVLQTLEYNEPGFIIITDEQSNNIGSITFYSFYRQPLEPIITTKTLNKSLTYGVPTATGILSDYLNGSVVIDYTDANQRTVYLFKR
jgi:hypothetical protein